MVAGLAFMTYQIADKILPKANQPIESSGNSTAGPIQTQQSAPQIDTSGPNPAPSSPVERNEQQQVQQQPVSPPPVKEEPKLRPVRDIKVVMYMTDW